MAEPMPTTSITRSDIEATATRLESFVASLPEQERNVLAWIIARAQAAPEEDVSGYVQRGAFPQPVHLQFQSPLASQLGAAAGFKSDAAIIVFQPVNKAQVRPARGGSNAILIG
jgi:hypothetical protein